MVENGIFREFMFYFMHKVNEGGDIVSTKIDKVEHGRLYKIARQGERSLYGQYDWTLPDGQEVVLIGLDESFLVLKFKYKKAAIWLPCSFVCVKQFR